MYLIISTPAVPATFETVTLPGNSLDSLFPLSKTSLEALFWNAL
jgi:hypothetical protein